VKVVSQYFSNRRLWRRRLNGVLYIPDQGRFLVEVLNVSGPTRMVEELERLSALGSPWASAVLGCICLRPGANGERDVARAIVLCAPHAERRDPYALFVYAWALLHSGKRNMAIRTMQKSALLKFPPAVLDFVTFVWSGWGMKEANPQAALQLLNRAFKVHHAMALAWLSVLYRSGKYGLMRHAFGYVLIPLAWLRVMYAASVDPFSCTVFTLSTKTLTMPFFREWRAIHKGGQ